MKFWLLSPLSFQSYLSRYLLKKHAVESSFCYISEQELSEKYQQKKLIEKTFTFNSRLVVRFASKISLKLLEIMESSFNLKKLSFSYPWFDKYWRTVFMIASECIDINPLAYKQMQLQQPWEERRRRNAPSDVSQNRMKMRRWIAFEWMNFHCTGIVRE